MARLISCPDCGRRVSTAAFSCPACGRPFRMPPRNEGPYLRTMNAATVAFRWLIGVPILCAILLLLLQLFGTIIRELS